MESQSFSAAAGVEGVQNDSVSSVNKFSIPAFVAVLAPSRLAVTRSCTVNGVVTFS